MDAQIAQLFSPVSSVDDRSALRWDLDVDDEDLPLKQPKIEEHTSELQSHHDLVCRLLLEKKKNKKTNNKKKKKNNHTKMIQAQWNHHTF